LARLLAADRTKLQENHKLFGNRGRLVSPAGCIAREYYEMGTALAMMPERPVEVSRSATNGEWRAPFGNRFPARIEREADFPRHAPTSHQRMSAIDHSQSATGTTGQSLVPSGEPAVERDGANIGSAASSANVRPSATFLAQLAATAQRAPQTRARRRANADHAAALYAAAVAKPERPRVLKIAL
jgi:hypothetical protein